MKLDNIKAALASNTKLLEDNRALVARNKELETALEAANGVVEASIDQQQALVDTVAEHEATIDQLESEAETVGAQTMETVAELGVAPEATPQASEAPVDEEGLRDQLKTETDPVKKGKICAQLRELRWPAK